MRAAFWGGALNNACSGCHGSDSAATPPFFMAISHIERVSQHPEF